jgi:cell division protein FtsB
LRFSRLQKARSHFFRIILRSLCFLILIYFSFHVFYGDRGLIAHYSMQNNLSALQNDLSHIQADKSMLLHKLAMMRAENGDYDMLDERLRFLLNVAHKRDVVIYSDGHSDKVIK